MPTSSTASGSIPRVENQALLQRKPAQPADRLRIPIPYPTTSTEAAQLESRKNGLKSGKACGNRHLRAQLLGKFVQQPVQILIALAHLFNLVHGMQHGCMVLSAKLAPNFR